MFQTDDVDEEFFYAFAERLPLAYCAMVFAIIAVSAYLCVAACAKAAMSPFARVPKRRATRQLAVSSDGLSSLRVDSRRQPTRQRSPLCEVADNQTLLRRAA
jgi:hypothetical protein